MLNYYQFSEEELLHNLANNDRAAMKYIYEKHAPAIYDIILKENKINTESEEILISTFLSFFNSHCSNPALGNYTIFTTLCNIALGCIKLSLPLTNALCEEAGTIYTNEPFHS